VKLTLPWKISSFIHYVIDSEWPLKPAAKQAPCKIQAMPRFPPIFYVSRQNYVFPAHFFAY
jgi:hypothetical protein